MTGVFLRVMRNGKGTNVEVEYLTDEERETIFSQKSHIEVIKWLNLVCHNLELLTYGESDNGN